MIHNAEIFDKDQSNFFIFIKKVKIFLDNKLLIPHLSYEHSVQKHLRHVILRRRVTTKSIDNCNLKNFITTAQNLNQFLWIKPNSEFKYISNKCAKIIQNF